MADDGTPRRRRHGMTLRGPAMAKSRPWASLPAEIRLMILEAIAQQKHPGWASLASVSREWQAVIARENLGRLKLEASSLEDMERMIVRQQHLIRHIQLEVELPRYSCDQCTKDTSMCERQEENDALGRGISTLFRILSTWESAGQRQTSNNGLTLDLNAYSPSDAEHWFKRFHFSSHAHGNNDGNCQWDDPGHGWINGKQVATPPAAAIPRLFSIVSPALLDELPQVASITRLTIRRQLRRAFCIGALLRVLSRLNGLEHLVYEPWRQWSNGPRDLYDQFWPVLVEHLPKTLKTVSVFEDFSDSLAAVLVEDQNQKFTPPRSRVEAVRVVNPAIGAAFAARSLGLEQLSVSYMVDAEDFFAACLPSWTWPRLEFLALTSQLLCNVWKHGGSIEALLYEAGTTALRMPRLRALAIWNGREGHACAFIYHTDRNYAYITWRGTWKMDLSPRVVEVWERVAWERRSCPLRVAEQHVQAVIGSHGDAIHHLALPCPVVAPESLWQIRREGR